MSHATTLTTVVMNYSSKNFTQKWQQLDPHDNDDFFKEWDSKNHFQQIHQGQGIRSSMADKGVLIRALIPGIIEWVYRHMECHFSDKEVTGPVNKDGVLTNQRLQLLIIL